MLLEDLAAAPGFPAWSHADKVRAFAWFVLTHEGRPYFTTDDLRRCFDGLGVEPPQAISPYVSKMLSRKPKEALRAGEGYVLERRVRQALDEKLGKRPAAARVDKLLADLPARLPEEVERVFLDEAIACFRSKAYRASMVMTWNLAFDHLCTWVIAKHLGDFNVALPKRFPRADISVIAKRDDLAELKESQVIEVCRSAGILTPDQHKIFKEKLDRRNMAAHPSRVMIPPETAEEFIKDLVTNGVLALMQ
ncbi:hypothetical protein [Anaeromyxobacter soli]|uniref:hypothetical protein n=1 Tax=Anaeromyxobacter soli TaxID=2922725 RepID=UPI001FAFC905|nr:hypothetical protein [Anaeromyxobacter sp. SG29]